MNDAEQQVVERRSSVKISTTARGEPTVEVKAYSHDLESLDATSAKALAIYQSTCEALAR